MHAYNNHPLLYRLHSLLCKQVIVLNFTDESHLVCNTHISVMAAGMATSACSNSGVIRIVCETLLGIASSATSYQFTKDLSLQNKISKYIINNCYKFVNCFRYTLIISHISVASC